MSSTGPPLSVSNCRFCPLVITCNGDTLANSGGLPFGAKWKTNYSGVIPIVPSHVSTK
jgi:hypothetical protein